MKLQHLTGRKTCDRVRSKGYIWKGKTMVIRWISLDKEGLYGAVPRGPERSEGLYVGTYAPGTLHKSAVKRNRMRRRCMEAMRLILQKKQCLPAMQLLLCPRIASLTSSFDDIRCDIELFFSSRSL